MEQIRISDSEIIYQRRRVFIFIGECKSDCSFRSNNFILSMFIQQINLDTSLCVDSLLPQIFSHYEQMKDTFNQIDTLEAGVKTVEASISSMELELSKAEAQLGSESVFKTVFRPFLVPPLLQSSILFIYTYYQLFFYLQRPSGVPMTHQTPCSYNQVAIFNTDEIWTVKEEP